MNRLLLLIILVSGMGYGQIINFTDPKLKQRLLQADQWNGIAYTYFQVYPNFSDNSIRIDTNEDGEIQVSEALQVKSLNVSTVSGSVDDISDMTGIGYFANLEVLLCTNNAIATLDVTPLSNLKILYCYNNPLVSLNITGLNTLGGLNCSSNLLSTLDIHANPLLSDLGCSNNPNLTSLIIKNGVFNACPLGVGQFNGFSGCPNLTYVCTDEGERACIQQTLDWNFGGSVIAVSTCTFALENEEFESNNWVVSPNPTNGLLHIQSDADLKSVELHDVQGRLLRSFIENKSNIAIDISSYPKGFYFLRITSNNGSKVEKIIKE